LGTSPSADQNKHENAQFCHPTDLVPLKYGEN